MRSTTTTSPSTAIRAWCWCRRCSPRASACGASGAELIAAYVAGYETWGELASRDADKHHGKGWHPSAVFGAVAAAAAGARLAKLDAARTTHALAAAASMAGGLTANFGSMMKPLQVARAAQSGLARRAARGEGLHRVARCARAPQRFPERLLARGPRAHRRRDSPTGTS